MKNIVKKYFVAFKRHEAKALIYTYVACITVALVFNILTGIFNFTLRAVGIYNEKYLTVNDFELVGAEYVDEMTIINATNDTQMIYTGNIKNLVVKCDFSRNPGEFVCFYSNNENYSFGTHKMAYAQIYGDYYIFEFPYGTKQIRMDTGVEPSVTVKFKDIALNSFSVNDMFNLSTGELFTLLIIPSAVYFILDTVLKIQDTIKKKRK